MRASILSFASHRLRREGVHTPQRRNWSQQELAELYRVRDRLVQSGLCVALDLGLTDEGEPWAVFAQSESGDAFVHIARLGGLVVVANMLADVVYRGEDFNAITDQMLRDAPLVLPRPKAGEAKVVMHPRSVFTAFVAAAVVLSEYVRSIEPARAGNDQEKVAQDKAVAETKALFPVIFDRILARDSGWTAPIATAGASLMAAAVGAVLIADNGKDDIPVVVVATREESGASDASAAFAADAASARADNASAVEAPSDDPQTTATPWSELKRVAAEEPARADDDRPAAIETTTAPEAKAIAEAPAQAAAPIQEIAGGSASSKTAAAADVPPQAPPAQAPQAHSASAADAPNVKELAAILDSIIALKLPQGANERLITLALDRALDGAGAVAGPLEARLADAKSSTEAFDHGAASQNLRNWTLHVDVAENFPAFMQDGNRDVVVLPGKNVTIVNFRFNEDFLLYQGEIDSTHWIQSIDVKGDDVTIVAGDGSVISLIDTHGLIA